MCLRKAKIAKVGLSLSLVTLWLPEDCFRLQAGAGEKAEVDKNSEVPRPTGRILEITFKVLCVYFCFRRWTFW